MLNRIAVSGGTYNDWIEAVYSTSYLSRAETPIYQGGASCEIDFQEVVSNSATEGEPLGTQTYRDWETDRKSTRLNSSHSGESRMPSSA